MVFAGLYLLSHHNIDKKTGSVYKRELATRFKLERLFSCSMPPQGTDWNYDKKLSGLQKVFSFLRGLNAPLIFFFHSNGNRKNFLEPEKFFFTRCTCFKSNFCPPRFLNLVNSPRLNCKDSPRTSSVLALNYADRMIFWSFTSWYSTTLASKLEVLSSITILSPFRVTNEDTDSRWFERVPQPLGFLRMESPIFSPKFKS